MIAVFWGEETTTVIFQLVRLDRFSIKEGIKGIDFQMHCCISVSVIVVLWIEDDLWSYGDLLVWLLRFKCDFRDTPVFSKNRLQWSWGCGGVGDVGESGECWAILCLFCWGIGFRVLITSGYGPFPSHYQRLGLCHVNQTNLSNVDYCEGGR